MGKAWTMWSRVKEVYDMAYLEYTIDKKRYECELTENDTSIGRSDVCTLQLLHDSELSRIHCSVQKQSDDSYVLVDEHAKNGTYLNNKCVFNEEMHLKNLDQITIGKTILTFREQAGGRTEILFNEIAQEMEEGKGFHTIMNQIIDKK